MSSVLHVSDLTKQFAGHDAVRKLTFSIERGETVGLVGPNGAGKTTTLSMILGFLRPSAGAVRLLKKHTVMPETAHKVRRDIGYITADMSLPGKLSGSYYLKYLHSTIGGDLKIQQRLISLLEPQLDTRIQLLSRGNKQKIALIAALQHNPKLVVMDEPTSGLDPIMQAVFGDILMERARSGGSTLMSSHVLSEVMDTCSRVMFMRQGRIMKDLSIEAIKRESGKIIMVKADPIHITHLKKSLPATVHSITTGSQSLTVKCDGDIQAAITWLYRAKIKDVTISEKGIDDLFDELYTPKETGQ